MPDGDGKGGEGDELDAALGDSPRRIRVLFVAEAVTLAHVARVHALAQLLDPSAFEICIASDPRYNTLVGPHAFEVQEIASIPSNRFAAALSQGRSIYDTDTLERYVLDDRRVMDQFDPDVVIGDFRLSLSVSAREAGKPYVNVTNAGWSPYASPTFTVPDLGFVKWLGLPLAQWAFRAAMPLAFRAHAAPLNTVRKRHGLAKLPADLRSTYTDGDHVLYADVPELFAMTSLPPTQSFIGAVLWGPEGQLPSWWDTLPGDRPVIYVTLGSSGESRVVGTIVESLASHPVSVIVATAGRAKLDRIPDNVFVADFLPGILAAHRSSVVICNGGSPTSYQALSAGVPVLGIASNLDQFLNMGAVAAYGAGLLLRPEQVSVQTISRDVQRLLTEDPFRRSASRLRQAIEDCRAAPVLDAVIRRMVAARERQRAASSDDRPMQARADFVPLPSRGVRASLESRNDHA